MRSTTRTPVHGSGGERSCVEEKVDRILKGTRWRGSVLARAWN